MGQSDSLMKLAEALCKAQSAMKPAKKDTANPFFKSHYADLASVWDAIREPLTGNGLSVVQLPSVGNDGEVKLTTMLLHTSGEWVSGDLTMKPIKNDPQAIGSCLTYARRYALSAITGVATEDDDAEGATGRGHSAPTEKPLQKPANKPAPSSSQSSDDSIVTAEGRIGDYTPQVGNKPGQFVLSTVDSDITIGFWKPELVAGITDGHDGVRVTYQKKTSKAGRAYNDLIKPLEWIEEEAGEAPTA